MFIEISRNILKEKSAYKPTLNQIRNAHQWKRDYERYLPVSRFLFRPVGFLTTWLAIRMGLTSESVSWLSAVTGLFACALLVTGNAEFIPVGIIFLLLFNLLDCVDGSIARVMQTENPYGMFLDSVCGEMVDVIFWTIIGILACQHHDLLRWPGASIYGASIWLIIGIVSSFLMIQINYVERTFDELIRSHWEKALQTSNPGKIHDSLVGKTETQPNQQITPSLRMIINNNIRVRENHYLFLIVTLLMRSIDVFLAFYFIYYLALYAMLLITYSRRGRIVRVNILSQHSDKNIK